MKSVEAATKKHTAAGKKMCSSIKKQTTIASTKRIAESVFGTLKFDVLLKRKDMRRGESLFLVA